MKRAVKPYNEAINRRRRGMDFGTGNNSDARRKHWKRVSDRDRTNAAHARHAGSADALRGDDGDSVVCAASGRRVLLSGRDVCCAAAAGVLRSGGLCGRYAGLCRAVCRRGVGRLLAAPRLHDALAEHGALGETGQSDDDGGSGFSDPVDGRGGDGRWKWV